MGLLVVSYTSQNTRYPAQRGQGQVVLVARVVFGRLRVEEVVSGGELEGHARQRPDVCRRVVRRAQDHLRTTAIGAPPVEVSVTESS